MNLTCPSCATQFVVEAEQLGPGGRKVRCGACGHSWHQALEAPAATPATAPAATAGATGVAEATGITEPGPGPGEEQRAERAARRAALRHAAAPPQTERRASLAVGWLALLVVVVALAAGLYFGREQVIALAPASARLYALVGLEAGPAPATLLALRDVRSERRVVDGEKVVVIEGLVANLSDQPQPVPLLRASLTDSKGVRLEQWTFAAGAESLPPGATTGFETVARNPPGEGNLSIEFVAGGQ